MDMSLAVQLEIVRCLKKMAKKDSLKKNLRSNPRRIIRQHDSE